MFIFIKLPNRIISYDCVKTMLDLKRKWIKKILVFRDIAFAAPSQKPTLHRIVPLAYSIPKYLFIANYVTDANLGVCRDNSEKEDKTTLI